MTAGTSSQEGRPPPGALLGVSEVAARLGVKPNTVIVWRRRHADFPEPLVQLAAGPIWWAADIDAWSGSRTHE